MLFALEFLLILCIGLTVGSFSTALSHRIPRDVPWWGGARSSCPDCNAVLGLLDLVPAFSWFFSNGRCRHCKAAVSIRYPLVELGCGILAVISYLMLGFTADLFILLVALPFLVALFFIDLEHMILPNQLVLILFILGVVRAFMLFPMSLGWHFIIASFIYGGVAWFLAAVTQYALKKEALGFGDVKFFAVAGLWLGLQMLPYFMICSGALALIFGWFWINRSGKGAFPFGPALIFSFYTLFLIQGSHLL